MNNAPIGVFDSGMGGISVLKKLVELMPGEKFIYYGDSANAPYGTKTDDEAFKLSCQVFDYLLDRGCKAIVVACNTATSVAISRLRERHPDLPVIGIEPAIKPAAEHHRGGRLVVMATDITLRRKKFADLMEKYSQDCEIIPVPCPGLVEFIEGDRMDSPEMMAYLKERFDRLGERKADAVVLGCTHYPFIAKQIRSVAGQQAVLYDGAGGTARETRRRLAEADLLSDGSDPSVEIINSKGQSFIDLSRKLFEADLSDSVS